MSKVHVSPEALARLTLPQVRTIYTLVKDSGADMEVFTAFELPSSYVAFTLRGIYGGIDPDGVAHT